jgi:inhibitor of growth protein 3
MADPATAYSLALLAEYTHSLDSLPLDLSRNFADLRELDAVLSSSMALITAKINQLTKMIEDRTASPEDRLWLLTEIGDEANRLKLGGEDKIRVASAAADNLRNHKNHLIDLLRYLPNFDPSVLNRTTYYPHVTSKSYPPHNIETGRRQRRGGNLTSSRNNDSYFPNDPNAQKRKRGGGRDDDAEVGPSRTPRKEKIVDMSNGRPRNTGRGGGGGRRYVSHGLASFHHDSNFRQCRISNRISRVCRFAHPTKSIITTNAERPS